MGTKFFHAPRQIQSSGLNMEARANNAPAYAGPRAGGRAMKDLGAAQAMGKGNMGPLKKDVPADAPGPKI